MNETVTIGTGLAGCGKKFECAYPGWPGTSFERKVVSLNVRRVTRKDKGGGEEVQIGVGIVEVKASGKRLYQYDGEITLNAAQAAVLLKAIAELDPNTPGNWS